MFTAAVEFFCPLFQKKSYFATNPLSKSKGKAIFQKANKTQKQGSRQAKIIPQNSAVAKKGGKSNSQSSLEKTLKKFQKVKTKLQWCRVQKADN